MGIYFVVGAMFSSFILIQIEFGIIFSLLILANLVPAYAPFFRVAGAIVAFLLVAGHIRATTAIMPEVMKKSEETIEKAEKNEEKINKIKGEEKTWGDIFYSTLFTNFYLIFHGLAWRFKKEGKYIRRVAGFNFQTDENVK
jgi:energy-coupling factor transporter transmembrane protein EcfT